MYNNIHANGLRPEIHQILQTVGLAVHRSEILRIGAVAARDGDSAARDMLPIDKTIPGLGLHNINERTDAGGLTAVARIEDRPIFRPIQYVGMYLQSSSPEWLTRNIVTMSCLHVENSLKRRLNIEGRLSIGMILTRSKARSLSADLHNVLQELNEVVYNRAKHSIEVIGVDRHMFSIADSLAVYFTCRTLGYRLLKDTGITTKYGALVF